MILLPCFAAAVITGCKRELNQQTRFAMDTEQTDLKVRIDKWLWAARFYKTRNLAAQAVSGGRVHVNGQRSKTSRQVVIGDVIEVSKSPYRFIVSVTALGDKRGSAAQAQQLYQEHPDSIAAREAQRDQFKLLGMAANPHPSKRPNKHARRQLKSIRGK